MLIIAACPLIAPPEFFSMYPEKDVPWPLMYDKNERPRHPFIDAMRKCLCFDEPFDAPMVRRAIAAYFALTSFLDSNIGKILATLEATGLDKTTRVLYSSDHGDNLGTRGLWGKSTMYEESAGVPMIMAGPGIAAGRRCKTPVSLVDVAPTILDGVGEEPYAWADKPLPGRSLFEIAAKPYDAERIVFSEYHAAFCPTGARNQSMNSSAALGWGA